MAFDSHGRLLVADRNNNRIQIFDQDGNFIEQFTQFSRPSGIAIDKNDMIYVSDSESESVSRNHYGWKRGIRIGSLPDGKMTAFIPDPVRHHRDHQRRRRHRRRFQGRDLWRRSGAERSEEIRQAVIFRVPDLSTENVQPGGMSVVDP